MTYATTGEAHGIIKAVLARTYPVLYVIEVTCAISASVGQTISSTASQLALIFEEIGILCSPQAFQARTLSALGILVCGAVDLRIWPVCAERLKTFAACALFISSTEHSSTSIEAIVIAIEVTIASS